MAKNCSGFSPLPVPPSSFGRARSNFSRSHLTRPLRPAPLAVAVAVYYDNLKIKIKLRKKLGKLTFISFRVTTLLEVIWLNANFGPRNERKEDRSRLLEMEAVIRW